MTEINVKDTILIFEREATWNAYIHVLHWIVLLLYFRFSWVFSDSGHLVLFFHHMAERAGEREREGERGR